MDAYESSLGPGEEDRHGGDPENSGKAAGEAAGEVGEPPSEGNSGEQIMERLPRTRPKRETPRSRAARTRAGGTPKAPRAKAGAARPRSRTAAPRKAATPPPAPERSEMDPAVFGPSEHAPGLPRLALDGAIEAAKLPIKVGANITFRALDAVTKSLRGR